MDGKIAGPHVLFHSSFSGKPLAITPRAKRIAINLYSSSIEVENPSIPRLKTSQFYMHVEVGNNSQ